MSSPASSVVSFTSNPVHASKEGIKLAVVWHAKHSLENGFPTGFSNEGPHEAHNASIDLLTKVAKQPAQVADTGKLGFPRPAGAKP